MRAAQCSEGAVGTNQCRQVAECAELVDLLEFVSAQVQRLSDYSHLVPFPLRPIPIYARSHVGPTRLCFGTRAASVRPHGPFPISVRHWAAEGCAEPGGVH